MKSLVPYIIKMLLAFVFSIAIVSIFCIGYRYSGVREPDPYGVTDYKWKAGQFKSTMVEGFAWNQVDSLGYVNDSVPTKIDMLLMGSSHQEALNVSAKQSTAAQLDSIFPNYSVYNTGMSGHGFYHSLSRLENALSYFKPRRYILIETCFVPTGPSMSWFAKQILKPNETYSGLSYQLQKIPALKWYIVNFEIWANLGNFKKQQEIKKPEYSAEDYEKEAEKLLSAIKETCNRHGVIPIIFYNPTQMLEKNGRVAYPENKKMLPFFKKQCDKTGIIFVDPTENFNEIYASQHVLAHGFTNTAVGVGHMNKHGHRALASAIASAIELWEGRK